MLARLDSRPWRRFVRLSLRGLIVMVLLIGLGLGWLVRSVRIQREAVAGITAAGGGVQYGRESSNRIWAPAWLVNLVGIDYFDHVDTVVLPKATDSEFAQVGRLTQLEALFFEFSSLSDAGWAHLNGLTKLATIGAHGPEFSDDSLAHLKGFPSLLIRGPRGRWSTTRWSWSPPE
jgi:hypothetical protein